MEALRVYSPIDTDALFRSISFKNVKDGNIVERDEIKLEYQISLALKTIKDEIKTDM